MGRVQSALIAVVIVTCFSVMALRMACHGRSARDAVARPPRHYSQEAFADSCMTLARLVRDLPISTVADSVDGISESQWDLYAEPGLLASRQAPVYDEIWLLHARPLAQHALGDDPEKYALVWAFIRLYVGREAPPSDVTSRRSLDAHFDTTAFTVNISLSDPDTYEGGEFLCLDERRSKPYKQLTNLQKTERLTKTAERGLVPVSRPPVGSVTILSGDRTRTGNVHGVMPLVSGERMVLCLFFNSKPPRTIAEALKSGECFVKECTHPRVRQC